MSQFDHTAGETKTRLAEREFTTTLLAWYRENGRHTLPWQKRSDWYTRLLSEVMLQQTQVQTVIPYFERFLAAYPTPEHLARAVDDEVMALWAGLGYYARCRNLLRAVRVIVNERGGVAPKTAAEWAELPGVGPSTGGAISAFVNAERAVMCDGNVKRSLSRIFAIPGYPGETQFDRTVWAKAEALLPESAAMADYTQAMMDLGALVCKRNPQCEACPMQQICAAYAQGNPTAYPGKKPKRERPIKVTTASVFLTGEGEQTQCWLTKREATGLWEGLWVPHLTEFVTTAESTEAPMPCPSDIVRSRTTLPLITHDFTHFRLILSPILFELTDEVWLKASGFTPFPARLDALPALPAPIKTLFEGVFTPSDGLFA